MTNATIIFFDMRISCSPELRYYAAGLIANDFYNLINSSTIKLDTYNLSNYLFATVSALLANNPSLALKLLENIKNHDAFKRHIKLFSILANEMLQDNQGNISNSIEKQFFDIFNFHISSRSAAYQIRDSIEYECSNLFSGIGNYLFTWLYLFIFKNQNTSTWSELRLIMMGNKKVNYKNLK